MTNYITGVDLYRDSASNIWQATRPKTHWDIVAILVFMALVMGLVSRPWDKPDPYDKVWHEIPQQKNSRGGKRKDKTSRNIAERLEQLNKDAVIFWGSQSGTAQAFAGRLERELMSRFSYNAMSVDLSDYNPLSISLIPASRLAIFIMSTFGEGDPSDNAADYISWLLKSAPSQSLSNLRYAALGLGDSNYLHFNRVITTVTEAMDALGATTILPVRKADAAVEGATEDQFLAWKSELLSHLQAAHGLQEKTPVYVPRLEVVDDSSLDLQDLHLGFPVHGDGRTNNRISSIVELPILKSRELFDRSSASRSCVHMEFDITDLPQIQYKTGDYLSVWPSNPDDEVDRLLSVLGLESVRDVPVLIKPLGEDVKLPVPTPTTRTALFRHYLEIGAPVAQDALPHLAQFAPGPKARSLLELLAGNKTQYDQLSRRTHLTLGRLLEYVAREEDSGSNSAWSQLPLSLIVENLSVLRPRLYSISSSNAVSPRSPSLTALVVQTPLAENPSGFVPGLASSFLQSLPEKQKIYAAVRKSKFHPPTSPATPLIMIAAGSGIAPFRGFVLERARLAQLGHRVGRTVLFFGCRHPLQDFVYREELQGAFSHLTNAELVPVFSRLEASSECQGQKQSQDPKQNRPRYVQDQLRARGEELARLIVDEGARVYVCGRAAMGREVAVAIREAVASRRPEYDNEKARMEWWEGWRRAGGYSEDVWG